MNRTVAYTTRKVEDTYVIRQVASRITETDAENAASLFRPETG
jgi:hypothetical protein